MIATGHRVWRLSKRGEDNLGLSCNEDGLFLGRTPLIERQADHYLVRPPDDLERLLNRAYLADVTMDLVLSGLTVVAAALSKGNLCLAQIAAVHLRLPDLPDVIARVSLEAEDRLIKLDRRGASLASSDWDESRHPRIGTSPNPGWFAPTSGFTGGLPPTQVAQNEKEELTPEETLDPMAPVRRQLWQSGIGTLREIDPSNPQLSYLTAPGWVPRQADLDTLDGAINAAATRRVLDKVMPGGTPIGQPGRGPTVRELPGGAEAANALFDYLRVGGRIVDKPELEGTLVRLPGNAGYVTLRPISTSGPPAVDVNLSGIMFMRLHFLP